MTIDSTDLAGQNAWLKNYIANLKLPEHARQTPEQVEQWLAECGMPALRSARPGSVESELEDALIDEKESADYWREQAMIAANRLAALSQVSAAGSVESDLTPDADIARGFPDGSRDLSTFEAIETALDRAGAPAQDGNRWLTLPERIAALSQVSGRETVIEECARAIEAEKLGRGGMLSGTGMAAVHDGALNDAIAAIRALSHPAGRKEGFDLISYLGRQWPWSKETFGPGDRTAGVLDHIRKELKEIEANPDDLSEWVDVVILAMDGVWRRGFTAEQFCAALQAKQDKNFARQWPDWRTMPTDKAIEHIKTAPPSPEKDAALNTKEASDA